MIKFRKFEQEYTEKFFKIAQLEKSFIKSVDKEEKKRLFKDYLDILKLINDDFIDNDLNQPSITDTILGHINMFYGAAESLIRSAQEGKKQGNKNASLH
jgi:dimeric dUTPase (all-alpha-NTP-PPase superfamily)